MEPNKHQTTSIMKWIVYMACCAVALIDFALLFSFGALFVHLLDKYGDNRATTATVQSLFVGVSTSSGLFSGVLVKKLGAPKVSFMGSLLGSIGFIVSYFAKTVLVLDIFIGIFSGIGISFLFVSSTIVVGRLFEGKFRETALAFQTFVIGIGLIGYPYLLDQLAFQYGISGSFLILGGIFLNNIVISFLYSIGGNRNFSKGTSNQNHQDDCDVNSPTSQLTHEIKETRNIISICLFKLRKNVTRFMHVQYLIVVLATGFVVSSNNGFLVVLVDLLTWKGLSSDVSLSCFTAYNVANTIVRAFTVLLSNARPKTNPAVILVLSALCGCVGQLLIWISNNQLIALVGSALAGLCIGGTMSGSVVAVAIIMPRERFGVAFGLLLSVNGILSLASGPLYGHIRDEVQSYGLAIVLTGAVQGAGALLYAVTWLSICYRGRK